MDTALTLLRETNGPEETRALATAWGARAVPVPPGGLVLDLRGPLGAGKTVFVQGLALGLGVDSRARVVSPTFTIARSYACHREGVTALHHLDAYRLGDENDLEAAGFEEMCGPGAVTCVEWGGRVEAGLPRDRLVVRIDAVDASKRRVRCEATGPEAAAVLQRWSEESS